MNKKRELTTIKEIKDLLSENEGKLADIESAMLGYSDFTSETQMELEGFYVSSSDDFVKKQIARLQDKLSTFKVFFEQTSETLSNISNDLDLLEIRLNGATITNEGKKTSSENGPKKPSSEKGE